MAFECSVAAFYEDDADPSAKNESYSGQIPEQPAGYAAKNDGVLQRTQI